MENTVPKLTENDYRTLFYILLKQVGGMGVKRSMLKSYPMFHDTRHSVRYDPKKDAFELFVSENIKPTIVVPQSNISLTNRIMRRFRKTP